LVDYVVFGCDADGSLNRAFVTMMLPLRGGLLRIEDGVPAIRFADSVVLISQWTERTAAVEAAPLLSACLQLCRRGLLVLNGNLHPPAELLLSNPVIVQTIGNGDHDRMLVEQGIIEARAVDVSTTPRRVKPEGLERRPLRKQRWRS